MFQEAYRGSALLHLPMFALFLFIAVFVGTLAWLFVFQRRSDRFAQLARLPFDEAHDIDCSPTTRGTNP